mmetsp:Transcript_7112/g.9599  ORF Transcript_7112/g.9599 Transcript_7112/m.9599 type:complete len:120 (+) Transcript_7112:185-544(+)
MPFSPTYARTLTDIYMRKLPTVAQSSFFTKNANPFKAYRSGVVIVVCKGCQTKHLIADNLGWSIGFEPETSTIEDYLEANGRTGDINRVSSEVFELERVLDMTDNSGSIVDEGGNKHLE